MGSLVPGWDADIGVPRDLVDNEKEPEPAGYFEKLRSHRHSCDTSGDQATATSASRVSALPSLAPSASKPGTVRRSNTASHGGAAGPQQQHKYQLTDWSEELNTLRPRGLARTSVGAVETGHEPAPEGGAWWRSLEVGHLNEHPDADKNFVHDTQRSTFVPQLCRNISAKLDFGDEGEKK